MYCTKSLLWPYRIWHFYTSFDINWFFLWNFSIDTHMKNLFLIPIWSSLIEVAILEVAIYFTKKVYASRALPPPPPPPLYIANWIWRGCVTRVAATQKSCRCRGVGMTQPGQLAAAPHGCHCVRVYRAGHTPQLLRQSDTEPVKLPLK